MIRRRRRMAVLVMVAFAAFATGGCVTSRKYRLAKSDTPPAAPLNFTTATPELDFRLVTVIVYDGPGSWKQRARWDEYGASLTNRSAGAVMVDQILLIDLLGAELLPGADPWDLERLSEANWSRYARLGRFVLGVGAAAGAMELAALGYGLAGGVLSGIFFVMPAALIADVAVVAVMNQRNKRKVEREFDRRRLALPLTLPPGQTVTGSLFFPVAPSPQRLILKARAGQVPVELTIDLAPLAGLHVAPAGEK